MGTSILRRCHEGRCCEGSLPSSTSGRYTSYRNAFWFVTGRNEVVAKVMFLQVSVILSTGGVSGEPPGPGRPPRTKQNPPGPRRTPPTRQTPPDQGEPPRTKENPPGTKENPPGTKENSPWDQGEPPRTKENPPPGPRRTPPKKTAAYGQ